MSSTSFAAIFGLGTPELVLILAIVLLLFGGAKLPQLARGIGTSLKELRGAMGDAQEVKKTVVQSAADLRDLRSTPVSGTTPSTRRPHPSTSATTPKDA